MLNTQRSICKCMSNKIRPPLNETVLLFLEVPPGFEPGNGSFADFCLTTWLWYRCRNIMLNQKWFVKICLH